MLSRLKHILQTSLTLLLFSAIPLFGGNYLLAQHDPEIVAKQHFEKGEYKQALSGFRDLVRLYPSDEALNYYLGASLSETKIFTKETFESLEIAKRKFSKSFFYLGQYYHAHANWDSALRNYQVFREDARKKEIKETRVEELMNQCRKQVNPFPAVKEKLPDEQNKQQIADAPEGIFQISREKEIPEALKDSIIHFQVNAQIIYLKIDQFKNKSSKEAFAKGWLIEQDLHKKLKQLSALRETYENQVGAAKDSTAQRILKLEQETYQMDKLARSAYIEADNKESVYWDKAGTHEIDDFMNKTKQIQDSIQAAQEKHIREKGNLPVVISDTTAMKTLEGGKVPPAKPADKVVYKIQIGAFSKTPPVWIQRIYKRLSVIRRIDQHTDENGITVYTVGELSSFRDAVQMQKQIRTEGVKDAFIAAYKNNKRISLNEAKKITGQ